MSEINVYFLCVRIDPASNFVKEEFKVACLNATNIDVDDNSVKELNRDRDVEWDIWAMNTELHPLTKLGASIIGAYGLTREQISIEQHTVKARGTP